MADRSRPGNSLEARVHIITLGVEDLERALSFYRYGLGLSTQGITGTEFTGDGTRPAGDVVIITLDDGLVLALYPRSELAKDAGLDPAQIAGSGVSLGHFVDSRADVDRVLQLAAEAGARVLGPAHDRPWGIYSGYFSDPDGHLWEIIYFPRRDAQTTDAP